MKGRAIVFGWNQIYGIVMMVAPAGSRWNDGTNLWVCFPGGLFQEVDAAQFVKYADSVLADIWLEHVNQIIEVHAGQNI